MIVHDRRPNKNQYRFLGYFHSLNDYLDWTMSNYIMEPYLVRKGFKIELWEKW